MTETAPPRHAARRSALNEWRMLHGVPLVRSWRDRLSDPVWGTFAWMAVTGLLLALGLNAGWAILAPFVALVITAHVSRAIRRRKNRS